ncbi:MAG: STAS domain-containing protein [Lachnospiraceae bacterium]|nr:STAS domain-containing protein [Lachnospiraceae bacterium]
MTLNETKGEGSIQISVEGQVDTVTAPELQQAILTAFQKTKELVLDLQGVGYMSSAGLRALLLGQKTASSKGGKMTVINVQPVVMQVFNMSGFAKVLNIE